jgi:hypothetical protein
MSPNGSSGLSRPWWKQLCDHAEEKANVSTHPRTQAGPLEALVRLRANQADEILDLIRKDPSAVMTATGMTPDPWQAELLASETQRILLLASRQAGKSEVAAALSLREALLHPGSLILLLSPSERQSQELQMKVFNFYDALEAPVGTRKRTELQLHLVNGSRIIALPESERTI